MQAAADHQAPVVGGVSGAFLGQEACAGQVEQVGMGHPGVEDAGEAAFLVERPGADPPVAVREQDGARLIRVEVGFQEFYGVRQSPPSVRGHRKVVLQNQGVGYALGDHAAVAGLAVAQRASDLLGQHAAHGAEVTPLRRSKRRSISSAESLRPSTASMNSRRRARMLRQDGADPFAPCRGVREVDDEGFHWVVGVGSCNAFQGAAAAQSIR